MFALQQLSWAMITIRRLLWGTMGAALLAVVCWSNVDITVWFFGGFLAQTLTLVYAGCCLFWCVRPRAAAWLHPYMAFVSILIISGRIGGFVELAVGREELALTGAIIERTFIGLCLLQLHIRSAHGV